MLRRQAFPAVPTCWPTPQEAGSELSLAVQAHETLVGEGIRSRVVSMPSWDIFEEQSADYRDSVLPPTVRTRLAIEQASTFGWERYVGQEGRVIGMHTFGASAPLKELQRKFGFEPERVVALAKEVLAGHRAIFDPSTSVTCA
jgi:transketolase